MRSEVITKENFIEGKASDMREAIESVLDHMRKDYNKWSDMKGKAEEDTPTRRRIIHEMIDTYSNGLRYEEGSKYIKLIGCNGGGSQESVKGFIVKEDEKKFRRGDMLKAAGWKAPARNFSRGNVFRKDTFEDNVRWTGIG